MGKFYVNIELSHNLYKVCKEDVKHVHFLKKIKRPSLPTFQFMEKYIEIEPTTDCPALEV